MYNDMYMHADYINNIILNYYHELSFINESVIAICSSI